MTDTGTVRQVIRFLGWLAILLVLGVISLAWRVLNKDTITAEEVSILTPLVGLAGTAVGAVGALLVSTHSVSPPPTPDQVDSDLTPDDAGHSELVLVGLIAVGTVLGLILFALTHIQITTP